MKRALLILALAFCFGRADINTIGNTQNSGSMRVTALVSAGYARYFIHLDDLSRAKRVIICEALFDDVDSTGLTALEALEKANVTYEKGFKRFAIGNTKESLECVGIGD